MCSYNPSRLFQRVQPIKREIVTAWMTISLFRGYRAFLQDMSFNFSVQAS